MSNFARLTLIAWFGQRNQLQVLFSELNSILTDFFFFYFQAVKEKLSNFELTFSLTPITPSQGIFISIISYGYSYNLFFHFFANKIARDKDV